MRRRSIEKLIIAVALALVYWFISSGPLTQTAPSTATATPTPALSPTLSPTAATPQPQQPTINVQTVTDTDTHTVTRVIDGDTIEIETGQKVRYIGIDTPELHHPTKGVQCYGEEARKKNELLVAGKLVKLVKDISETDRYGRLLRYVFLQPESSSAEIFVNEVLVKEGYAHARTYPPDVAYETTFRAAEKQARENKLGLWQSCVSSP